ncbi:hypothetical protein [Bowmanella pacifica]|uniref:NIPSNAP domain-containing protein n=1 Tax=Bowmanella pacifica TaxID=502051 RepID=A0A917YTH5_9ALTE|nr:hypothetical protein [Bowmanella pacifica]GGO66556.1 hypothetical protein GCM10010982_11020 [Bowmanella pacifica]
MKTLNVIAGIGLLVLSAQASAQVEVYKDYDISEQVTLVTTVKVDANMLDYYLEGLRDTWVAANRLAKSLGHLEDFHIYSSELPQSGDFNLMLVVTFKSGMDLEPSKKRYEEFMKKWGEERNKNSRKIAKTYPDVRQITGDYRLREIMLK